MILNISTSSQSEPLKFKSSMLELYCSLKTNNEPKQKSAARTSQHAKNSHFTISNPFTSARSPSVILKKYFPEGSEVISKTCA